jgi:hypothetical protein
MLPCHKRHKSSSGRTQRDLNQQKHNQTLGYILKGLEEEEEEEELGNIIQARSRLNMKLNKT